MVDSVSVYGALEGIQLNDQWSLGAIRKPSSGATGGNFSVQFDAIRHDGAVAFCKVLDLVSSAQPPNVAQKVEYATKAFNYEAELVEMCARFNARRVVYALHAGEIYDARVPLGLVSYIIFEKAEDDIRTYLDDGKADDLASRFKALRHTALGVRELHGMRIAHQDLKPSNVLVFAGDGDAKVADLGRASLDGSQASHDASRVAGAFAYSPPELLYGQVSQDFYARRQACDLYQLGALIAFVVAGTSINREWNSRLFHDEQWRRWGDPYSVIYPRVRQVMNEAFDVVEAAVDSSIRTEVGALVRDLCNPDAAARGTVLQGKSQSKAMILNRLISSLNLLEHKTRVSGLRVT